MRRFHSNYGLTSNHLVCWRAWCEAPYLRHYNGVFSTSAVAADTNHADLQTSLARLVRIELTWVSCSSLPFTKCRVLPHLRSGLGGFIILVESATKPTRGRFDGCGGDLNPAWCRQYATSFVPVRGGCLNLNRFECAALSCTAYPCCLFHSATHPYSAVSPAVTAACRLLAVSPRGYTFPSACCDPSTADPFRLVLRQVTGRGGTDQT